MAAQNPLHISSLFNVNGMVAVITGGGSGLGSYAAKALDANGAKAVYIVGRREESLKQVAAQAVNGSIIPLVGDVTDKDSLTAMAERVRKEHGYLDLLFANAGILGPKQSDLLGDVQGKPSVEQFQQAMWKSSMEEWTAPMHLNTTAVFFTAVAFLGLLDEGNRRSSMAQQSQILVTTSIAGLSRAVAAGFAYSVSKASANHMTKMLSTYLADYKIRVNAIAPGMYPSEMTDGQLKATGARAIDQGKPFAGAVAMSKDKSPAERTGSEQEFAGAVLYMVSQAGGYMNGEVMVTDGGRLSQLPAVY